MHNSIKVKFEIENKLKCDNKKIFKQWLYKKNVYLIAIYLWVTL